MSPHLPVKKTFAAAGAFLFLFFGLAGVHKTMAATASDNFNRANGSLGSSWTPTTDGGLAISSDTVVNATSSVISGDYWTGNSFGSDQYSEIQITSNQLSGGEWIGPSVRNQANGNLYTAIYYWNNGSPVIRLYKRVSGTFAQLGSDYNCGALSAGTALRLSAVGNTLFVFLNGDEKITYTDTDITGGAPGIEAYDTASADNWSGGDISNPLDTDANGVLSYVTTSTDDGYGAHLVRVLEPSNPTAGVAHNFLYALPVEPEASYVYGDPIQTLMGLNAQNTYNLTIIVPSFPVDPWYADNPNDTGLRFETYVTSDLAPWVKANFSTSGSEANWLIGFSKSGIGATDLILKHPNVFELTAAWDFPADMSSYDEYGASSADEYGTNANFQSNYELTQPFVDAHKTPFLTKNRIWISGYEAFQQDIIDFDALLTSENILHTDATNTLQTHSWDGGWVPGALASLYQDSLNLTPTIGSFTASPSFIGNGSSSTLSWNASNASSVTISGNNLNFTTTTNSGSVTVTPNTKGSLIYTLAAGNSNGTSTATTTLFVNDNAYLNGYMYRRTITVSSTLISPTSHTALTDFPILISLASSSYLAASSSGGTLQSAAGNDIMFSSDSNGIDTLNYEVAAYNPSTGAASYWIQVPTLSSSSNQIYLFYDNASITSSRAHPTSTWDNAFTGVWHLPNGTTLTANDSTANGNNGVINGATATPGQIDGAANFTAGNQIINLGTSTSPIYINTNSPFTVTSWVNLTDYDLSPAPVIAEFKTDTTSGWNLDLSNASNYLGISAGDADGDWANIKTGNLVSTSTWHQVTVAYDGESATNTNDFQFYLDGVAQTLSGANAYNTAIINGTNIGDFTEGGNSWHGAIDEVEVSSADRSADWIDTEYDNQLNPSAFSTIGSAQIENIPPSVNSFVIPGTSSSLTVPITSFAATDNVGVTGYLLTEASATPSLSDPDWSSSAPASYTFASAGTKTLYAWARDGAGNISEGVSENTTITLSSAPVIPSQSVVVSVAGSYGAPYVPGVGLIAPSTASTPVPATPSPSMASLQAQLTALMDELASLQAQAQAAQQQTSIPNFTRDLSIGMSGNDVEQLQSFLVAQQSGPDAKALAAHGITDFFWTLTQNALIEFQKKNNISPAIGYFGPKTRAAVAALE